MILKGPTPHKLMAQEAPDKPHFGVVVDEAGSLMALPPGAQIAIIEDPENPNKIFPMVLLKVTYKSIWFACACGQKGCTRRMNYQLKASGFHPQSR